MMDGGVAADTVITCENLGTFNPDIITGVHTKIYRTKSKGSLAIWNNFQC